MNLALYLPRVRSSEVLGRKTVTIPVTLVANSVGRVNARLLREFIAQFECHNEHCDEAKPDIAT